MDVLGAEVVPVLRREFERLRAPGVPSDPPLHPRVAALLGNADEPAATEAIVA